MGRGYRLRSKAAACTWVRQRVLPRWVFGSWCRQRHRVVRGRERRRWGRSVRRAPGGRVIEGRCIRDRRSDGWRTGRCTRGRCTRGRDAGRNYPGGRRAPLRPLGTRKNPLLFRAGLTSGDDEDEEAHKERHEQGKALSAARTDPHGYLAIQRAALLSGGWGAKTLGTPYSRGVNNWGQRPPSTIVRRGARNIRNKDLGNKYRPRQDLWFTSVQVSRKL